MSSNEAHPLACPETVGIDRGLRARHPGRGRVRRLVLAVIGTVTRLPSLRRRSSPPGQPMSPLWIRRTCRPTRTTRCRATSTRRWRCRHSRPQPNGSLEVSRRQGQAVPGRPHGPSARTPITYHLRSGVHFYPSGDPLTATDVKFSLDRIFSTPGAGDLQSNGIQGPSSVQVHQPHRRSRSSSRPRPARRCPSPRRSCSCSASTSPGSSIPRWRSSTRRRVTRTPPTGCGPTPPAAVRTTSQHATPA